MEWLILGNFNLALSFLIDWLFRFIFNVSELQHFSSLLYPPVTKMQLLITTYWYYLVAMRVMYSGMGMYERGASIVHSVVVFDWEFVFWKFERLQFVPVFLDYTIGESSRVLLTAGNCGVSDIIMVIVIEV